jgi:hypothetical protein
LYVDESTFTPGVGDETMASELNPDPLIVAVYSYPERGVVMVFSQLSSQLML